MASSISFETYHNIINGEKRSSKELAHGINPNTQEKLWDVPVASKQDVDDAVQAARTAFKSWSKTPFEERIKLLKKYGEVLKPHISELTELVVKEIGKPRQFAAHEAHSALEVAFDFFLNLTLPNEVVQGEDREYHLRYVPLGIVAAICPWNYPLGQATMKFLPGLAAGNTVIVKPSPFAPYSALKLVEIAQQVLPPGVLQVLNGDDKLGPWLVNHPDVNKISFAGSTATGKRIMESAAKTLKRVTLELGGNDACIVCADADIKKVAPEVVTGAFFNTGQVCAGTKRIYIHQDIYPQFLEAMAAFAKTLKVGDASEDGVFMGPLQNEMQYTKVKGLYEDAKANGYKTLVSETAPKSKGYFCEPTIVDAPPNNARVVTEEQFGPIVPTMPWTDEADVIERVNNSPMGLGASVWSKDVDHARRIAEQLEVGSVYINSFEKVSIKVPFGGHKESGIGFECGPSALVGYTNLQVVHYVR